MEWFTLPVLAMTSSGMRGCDRRTVLGQPSPGRRTLKPIFLGLIVMAAGIVHGACELIEVETSPTVSGSVDEIMTQLSGLAPSRSHSSLQPQPVGGGVGDVFRGGDFVPRYTLRRHHDAPSAERIREAVFEIDLSLEHWALQTGWFMGNCNVSELMQLTVLEQQELVAQTDNRRIVGLYTSHPEAIYVAFDADQWRATLAHELAHAAYARCDWGTGTRKHSEQFARAFEAWEQGHTRPGMPTCRGLFQRRRARLGLCL